jgi:hypothetical protein
MLGLSQREVIFEKLLKRVWNPGNNLSPNSKK